MYLLDTNVISEMRRTRPHGAVLAWLQGVDDRDLHLAAVTLGELQAGIEITRGQDEAKAVEIETWLDRISETYNVIAMNAQIFRLWARLMYRRPPNLTADAMIAATAKVCNLIVVTRNVRDFQNFDVETLNPFDG